jgi:hypothetical protein
MFLRGDSRTSPKLVHEIEVSIALKMSQDINLLHALPRCFVVEVAVKVKKVMIGFFPKSRRLV